MNTPTPEFDEGLTEFHEEWLSAYLDDELTDEQRRIVEDRVSVDPAAQATLSDLERIRGLVKQLPAWDGKDLEVPTETLTGPMAGLQSSDQEIDSSLETEGDDWVESEIRSQATENQPRFRSSDSSSGLTRWIRPLTLAASVLLVLGIGYVLWPRKPFTQVAGSINTEPDTASDSSASDPADSIAFRAEDKELDSFPTLPDGAAVRAAESLMLRQSQADVTQGDSGGEAGMQGSGMGGGSARSFQPSTADFSIDSQKLERSPPPPGARGAEPSSRGGQQPAEESLGIAEINVAEAIQPATSAARPKVGKAIPTPEVQEFGTNGLLSQGRESETLKPTQRPLRVFYGRSASWEDRALAQELASNPALNTLATPTPISKENASEALVRADGQSVDLSPIILARIPAEQDGEQLYARVLQENSLQPIDSPANTAAPLPSEDAGDLNFGAATAGSVPAAHEAVVLFLNRVEAESILQQLDRRAGGRDDANRDIQRYMWINPVGRAARNGDGNAAQSHSQKESEGTDRVILLLTSVGK